MNLDELMQGLPDEDPYMDGDLAHWIAEPMKDVGTTDQFHEVVNRAQKVLNYWRLRDQAHNQKYSSWPQDHPQVPTYTTGHTDDNKK
jgi:hypothetical protein